MLLVPILATIVVGFAAFSFYVDRVEYNNRIADIDDELARAERTGVTRGPTSGQPEPPDPGETDPLDASSGGVDPPVQLLVDPTGTIVATAGAANPLSDALIEALADDVGYQTVDGANYRVKVSPTEDGLVSITALSLDPTDEAVADFRRALAAGGAVILALVAAVVWGLTTALIRPVTRMSATASRIAAGALDTEVPPPSGSKEMADLAEDLDRMLARLRSALDDREQSAAEAAKARDDMQRFLADMAHELRTPLTALKGYSDLYAGGMLGETGDVDRAMARIGSESERLYRLANDMLQLAREGVADERARIRQAILNLAANACEHSDPTDEIAVTVASNDTDVELRVVDHGVGVDAASQDRIFLPFYRAEASRSRSGNTGAGLGLALTKQIADQHGGTVTYETTPGGGATFALSLPVAARTEHEDNLPGV